MGKEWSSVGWGDLEEGILRIAAKEMASMEASAKSSSKRSKEEGDLRCGVEDMAGGGNRGRDRRVSREPSG